MLRKLLLVAAFTAPISCQLHNGLEPWMFLGSKTPYSPSQVGPREHMPPQCKLVHWNFLGRHGSRHANRLKDASRVWAAMDRANSENGLSLLGKEAVTWLEEYITTEESYLGHLTPEGRMEHHGIGTRMWDRDGEFLVAAVSEKRPFVFEATDRSRTQGSRDGFVEGFVAASKAVLPKKLHLPPPTYAASAVGRDGLVIINPTVCSSTSQASSYAYAKLRFFETCNTFSQYKNDKPWLPLLMSYSANASKPTSHETAFLRQLFTKKQVEEFSTRSSSDFKKQLKATAAAEEAVELGKADSVVDAMWKKARKSGWLPRKEARIAAKLARRAAAAATSEPVPRHEKGEKERSSPSPVPFKPGDIALTAQLTADIYTLCQIELNALGHDHRFCSLFKGPHLEMMAKAELLRDLGDFYKQGAGDSVAFAPSCTLLEDFIVAGDKGAGIGKAGSDHTAASRAAARRHGSPAAHYRFGHSETVMPLISLLGLYQEPSAPTLEEYYFSELSRGTSALLNSTRQRLRVIQEVYGLDTETAGLRMDAEANADLSCKGKNCKGEGKQGKKADRKKPSDFTPIPSPYRDRAMPPGFSEPMLMALKHPWSGARLAPMAANVEWLMYDCGDAVVDTRVDAGAPQKMSGLWVKMLHNEREIGFPACGTGGDGAEEVFEHAKPANPWAAEYGLSYPCPWERVKEYYRGTVYPKYGITTCDAGDWERLCGGVGSCVVDGNS